MTQPPAGARIWIEAARPRTLVAALAPVLVGTAVAADEGRAHLLTAACALWAAVWIQIGANFANDLSDARRGVDGPDRLGPRRAVSSGLITPRAMRIAVFVAFLLASIGGAMLLARAGWVVLVLGGSGALFALLYTSGPLPLGALGLGEVLVLLYFGPLASAGTHWVQALDVRPAAALAGLGPGLLATALLAVNNLRDRLQDARAGRRSLAVRFGERFAKSEIAGCILGAALVPVALVLGAGAPRGVLLASGAALLGLPLLVRIRRSRPGDRLLDVLAGTGRLLGLYGLALAAGWLL